MMTGRMHTSRVVHVGRKVKTIQDDQGTHVLYAPFCQRLTRGTVAYLGQTQEAVTCRNCQTLLTTKPHLFREPQG